MPAFREVDPDLTEVALGPLAWLVRQREKRFALPPPRRGHVPSHLVVAADVLLFVPQPPKELRSCVTLLASACSSSTRIAPIHCWCTSVSTRRGRGSDSV